jgi:hypothetical protein
MIRLVLARALSVFLGLLALAMLWNGIDAFRYSRNGIEYGIMALQLLSAPVLGVSAYWLWRRDRRAVLLTGVGMAICAVVGTTAASYWTEPPERMSAGLGALGGSLVLLIVVVLLARVALKSPINETARAALGVPQELIAEDAEVLDNLHLNAEDTEETSNN